MASSCGWSTSGTLWAVLSHFLSASGEKRPPNSAKNLRKRLRTCFRKDFIGRDALAACGPPERRLVHLAVEAPEGTDCAGNEPIFNESTGDTEMRCFQPFLTIFEPFLSL